MMRLVVLCSLLMLSACGYQLVGAGNGYGKVPADVRYVYVKSASGSQTDVLFTALRQHMEYRELPYAVVTTMPEDASVSVELRVSAAQEQWQPIAYDSAGVVSQYRFTLSASIQLYRHGEMLWDSGVLSAAGDVYEAGTGVEVEAAKDRMREQLQQEWVTQAWARLQSGF